MILNMILNKLLVIFKQPPAKPEKEPISLWPHTQAAADFRGLVQRETVVRESAFSNVEEFSYMKGVQCTTVHGGCSSTEAFIINNGYHSSVLMNYSSQCWYPQSWKGLEWHLLNPGAQIFATTQCSVFSTGVKHHNKCSLSAL